MSNNRIGIFDSGVGGLTVAKAVKELLPNESIMYYGDTLHLPYGEKSAGTIIRYAEAITRYFLDNDCKAIVIACNSASAHAYNAVRDLAPQHIPVLNVIDPMASWVNSKYEDRTVGVIGTKATVKSGVYQERVKVKDLRVLETPLLASMIEEDLQNSAVSQALINAYLNKAELQKIDALILGCTHYPIIKEEIDEYYSGEVDVLDSSTVVAAELKRTLENEKLINTGIRFLTDEFLVSDYTVFFEKITARFFGNEIELRELRVT